MSAVAVKLRATITIEYVVRTAGKAPQEIARLEWQEIVDDPGFFVSAYEPDQTTIEVTVLEVTDKFGQPQ